MSCSGCLNLTRRQSLRRDFLRVGSLGLLGGINLPQLYVRADTQKLRMARRSPAFCCGWRVARVRWTPGIPSRVPPSSRSPRTCGDSDFGIAAASSQSAWTSSPSCVPCTPRGNDHPQGTHYAITGHEPNPAMHFPSLGAIISKESGPRNGIPANMLTRSGSAPPVRRVFPRRVPWTRLRSDGATRSESEEFRVADLSSAEKRVGARRAQPQGIS